MTRQTDESKITIGNDMTYSNTIDLKTKIYCKFCCLVHIEGYCKKYNK